MKLKTKSVRMGLVLALASLSGFFALSAEAGMVSLRNLQVYKTNDGMGINGYPLEDEVYVLVSISGDNGYHQGFVATGARPLDMAPNRTNLVGPFGVFNQWMPWAQNVLVTVTVMENDSDDDFAAAQRVADDIALRVAQRLMSVDNGPVVGSALSRLPAEVLASDALAPIQSFENDDLLGQVVFELYGDQAQHVDFRALTGSQVWSINYPNLVFMLNGPGGGSYAATFDARAY